MWILQETNENSRNIEEAIPMMMSVWHLLWILPVAATMGLFYGGLCAMAKDHDSVMDQVFDEKQ